jgi:hypothetical protein
MMKSLVLLEQIGNNLPIIGQGLDMEEIQKKKMEESHALVE